MKPPSNQDAACEELRLAILDYTPRHRRLPRDLRAAFVQDTQRLLEVLLLMEAGEYSDAYGRAMGMDTMPRSAIPQSVWDLIGGGQK
jgi:hypothetical protein